MQKKRKEPEPVEVEEVVVVEEPKKKKKKKAKQEIPNGDANGEVIAAIATEDVPKKVTRSLLISELNPLLL